MNKEELLELERNAHLSLAELRKTKSMLVACVTQRLEKKVERAIATRLSSASKELRPLVSQLKVNLDSDVEQFKLHEVAARVLKEKVAGNKTLAGNEEIVRELEAIDKDLATVVDENELSRTLGINEPIAQHPDFRKDLEHARVYRLSDATALGDHVAEVLIKASTQPTKLGEADLRALVKAEALTEKEAAAAGAAVSLFNVLDERPELVQAVTKAGAREPQDLVGLKDSDWEQLIETSKVQTPGDLPPAEYATLLRRKLGRLFPSEFLSHGLKRVETASAVKSNAALDELRKKQVDGKLWSHRNFSSVDVTDIPDAELKKLKTAFEETQTVIRRFPRMGLADVLDDADLSDAQKSKEFARRTKMAADFFADNEDVLNSDLRPQSKDVKGLVFTSNAGDEDKSRVLSAARTYQRSIAVADDIQDAEALVAGGFHSALAIARKRPETIASEAKLDDQTARRYHDKAVGIASKVTGTLGTVMEAWGGTFNWFNVGNVTPDVEDYLKEIPGYSDFFGNQNYCDCEHCQSILGPAAYFVDLMCFIDEKVSQEFFATQPAHSLALQSRRPDLWTLELTCENTTTPIPYLVIINEILENAVATESGFTGNYRDRVAVRRRVYRNTLVTSVDGFDQPLNLPFEELHTYLEHFGYELGDLADAAHAGGSTLARLRLQLPPIDFDLIASQTNVGLAFLRKVYGIQFTETGGLVKKFDAQLLLHPMKVTRKELSELVRTNFVRAKNTINIRITGERRNSSSVQNDIENISGLTRAALDRMHRFVRLWRATGWRIGELDIVLTQLDEVGLGHTLSAQAVGGVAALHRLLKTVDLSVEEATALWSTIPRQPVLHDTPESEGSRAIASVSPRQLPQDARLTRSLFDRIFNTESFVEADGSYPKPAIQFLHPALADTPPATPDPNLSRLLSGLGATEDQLLQLIVGLAKPLGVKPRSGVESERAFALSNRNLALLYRHARLARTLRISLPDIFGLASLTGRAARFYLEDLEDTEELLRLKSWLDTTDWNLSELIRIVRPAHPAVFTSQGPVSSASAGGVVTYNVTDAEGATTSETITLAANADLNAVVTDWNGQASQTTAYRSDALGTAFQAGSHLSIRSKASGSKAQVELTTDSAGLFAAALPVLASGEPLAPAVVQPGLAESVALASELVEQISESGSLVFSDTVFALVAPLEPIATSLAATNNTAAGDTVTYAVLDNGRLVGSESVVFQANADLDSTVADWNEKASLTRAFRSDTSGNSSEAGAYLSIGVDGATGSSSRIDVTAAPAALFAVKGYAGAEITEAQSRQIMTANAALFEQVGPEGSYQLKIGFDPATSLSIPASVDSSLEASARELITNYHSSSLLPVLLPSRCDVAPSAFAEITKMLGINLQDDVYFRELKGAEAPTQIAKVIEDVRRVGALFKDSTIFDEKRLEFVRTHAGLFDADFSDLSIEAIENVETFRQLLRPWLTRDETEPNLQDILLAFTSATRFAAASQEELARLLRCKEGLLSALTGALSFASQPFEMLRQLQRSLEFAQRVGVAGGAIKLGLSSDYDELSQASTAFRSAFRAQYDDEQAWEKKIEPFDDRLLSRRRDGLVAYLLNSAAPQFDEVSDLYHYYLIDIELDGCARTSRVAAAIDTAQLYVHRCLMNLEETPPGHSKPVHVLPESIPSDEWDWRKNYRVWEANRKIFLYPENFIEPELRDNKTPLFKKFEEELLAKEVTDESIIDAYARYLRGLDELANLKIAGSYHEKDEDTQTDVLHLCGVTSDEPPTYYYRRVENAHYGASSDDKATHWGPWEPMDVQVPVRKVSPIVHRGQLYIFWNRYTTKPRNDIVEGTSTFAGYTHRGFVEFSKRRLDGSWTAPQKLSLTRAPFSQASYPSWYRQGGEIYDTIVTKTDHLVGFSVRLEWLGQYIGVFQADAAGRLFVMGLTLIQLPMNLISTTQPTSASFGPFDVRTTPIRAPSMRAPRHDDEVHSEPRDAYTLDGFGWDRVYPSSNGRDLSLRAFDFQLHAGVDLNRLTVGDPLWTDGDGYSIYDRGVPWINPSAVGVAALIIAICTCGKVNLLKDLTLGRLIWSEAAHDKKLIHKTQAGLACFDTYTFATVLSDISNIQRYTHPLQTGWGPQWDESVTDYLFDQIQAGKIAEAPAEATVDVVNGSVNDTIIQTAAEAFYLQEGVNSDGRFLLRRLNTSVSSDISDILFNRGLDELLATDTQLGLQEKEISLSLENSEIEDDSRTGELDFSGAMGTYLREVFFHMPFLIADHLNSQGRFEDAQSWFHYIFDPTSSETISGLDPALSEQERRLRELDRNWRYREFRGLDADTLRAQLTNQTAIEQYRRDPFNPHAVARFRLSAYQKAVVMKYVDNLLDWGDELFARAFSQVNQEYLRLATLKYVTAQEILGPRPAELGDCGDSVKAKTLATIKDLIDDDAEFLFEFESWIAVRTKKSPTKKADAKPWVAVAADRASAAVAVYRHKAAAPVVEARAKRTEATMRAVTVASTRARSTTERRRSATYNKADWAALQPKEKSRRVSTAKIDPAKQSKTNTAIVSYGVAMVRQLNTIFCVPGNERMLAYWDRVADRLFKLRHCMDIDGVFRQLPLFAPPIDPALLVGGRAAGLSLDDMLASAAGQLPPYRFRYLLDKAKAYAASVQSFGTALLGALEKRDGEELARLRNTHQKNLLALTSEVKRNELKIAEEGYVLSLRRQSAAAYRKEYYTGLLSSGLTGAEQTQRVATITSSVLRGASAVLDTVAAIAYLVPQAGSPFAMKYGGKDIGDSGTTWGEVLGSAAGVADAIGTIAGLEAGYDRREQGWKHQQKLAENDLKNIEKEVAIAELRQKIATRGLELHDKSKAQHDEVIEFFGDKFTNLGLYTHLSRTLQKLHREAYTNAISIARLAEQAYRFERPGDHAFFVGGEWEASRSGLLAGERLNLSLQRMEKRFIETNRRGAEINQSFSLTQIGPDALISLKESGQCEFVLPELFFDMYYPGQYRRRIRAVRLTIPCVTGPYTNVSAKLTLLSSHIRRDPVLGADALFEVPPTGTTSVATSTGQGDAGVFELSFRSEQYMPFEGAGAVSAWRLELPAHFRPFDYQSINDAIINVSYTAEEDGAFRQDVESTNAATAGSLLHFLNNNSLTRVLSLRQEFSSAYNRLLQAPVGTSVTFDINERHFPLFLQDRALTVAAASLVVGVTDRALNLGSFDMSVNGGAVGGFSPATNPSTPADAMGGLPAADITAAFAGGLKKQHTIQITDPGGLANAPGIDGDGIKDVLVVLRYGL